MDGLDAGLWEYDELQVGDFQPEELDELEGFSAMGSTEIKVGL